MNEQDRLKLEKLKSDVNCTKDFSCVKNKFKNLCHARYSMDSNELECLEERTDICEFAIHHGGKLICTCNLRIYIEQNLDKWMAKSAPI